MNKKERKDLEENLSLLENLLASLIENKTVTIEEMERISNLPTTTPVNEIIYDALIHYNSEVLDKEIKRSLEKIDRIKTKLK